MSASAGPWDDVWRRWYPPFWANGQLPAAPDNLAQSVLPGWNFGTIVNLSDENSAAPQTEVAILRKQSYGRQLALQVLVAERAKVGARSDPALEKFSRMRAEIEEIKHSGLPVRVAGLCTELAALRKADGTQYARLRRRLLEALEE
jgi:hypothetical protein